MNIDLTHIQTGLGALLFISGLYYFAKAFNTRSMDVGEIYLLVGVIGIISGSVVGLQALIAIYA